MTALIRTTAFYEKRLSNLNFIKSDLANTIIGVGVVKWIVKNTFFKYLNQKLRFDQKINIADIKDIQSDMTKSEIDHLFAFMFVAVFMCITIFNQNYLSALVNLMVNMLMNLNPALLQQQNKRRIGKLLAKLEGRQKSIAAETCWQ